MCRICRSVQSRPGSLELTRYRFPLSGDADASDAAQAHRVANESACSAVQHGSHRGATRRKDGGVPVSPAMQRASLHQSWSLAIVREPRGSYIEAMAGRTSLKQLRRMVSKYFVNGP